MAATKVTSAELNPSKTVDANGWTVYDYGAFKEYKKRVTFSGVSVGTTASTFPISSTNYPVGVTLSNTYLNYSWTATGFAGELVVVFEGTSSTGSFNFTASSAGTGRTYTGFMDLTMTQQ